jgi:hypothetical protein
MEVKKTKRLKVYLFRNISNGTAHFAKILLHLTEGSTENLKEIKFRRK